MPKKETAEIESAPAQEVRIRMYRHGLGDCFLLRFPGGPAGPFHLVIDSGVIKGTANAATVMREVAEDIEKETGGRIDALVVTHEHWDHVSGFTEAREVWERMEIAEVWLAWTEKPGEELADKLREDRAKRKEEIKAKITALADGSSFRLDSTRGGRIDALLGFMGMGLALDDDAGGGTKGALDFISKHGKKRVYYDPGTSLVRKEIPGIRIYVLGPPKDEKMIKKSDPSATHPEVYSDPSRAFAFSGTGENATDEDPDCPFSASIGDHIGTPQAYDQAFLKYFPSLLSNAGSAPGQGGNEDPAWRRLDCESMEALEHLALALDGDTNNTCLALAFELADGRVLLFPADAQVGNWLSWQDYTWKAGTKPVQADDLLNRTVFYKVGHHGSHNATLKDDGLEQMSRRDLVAFIPVNKKMAAKKRWKMPFAPLYKRLLDKTHGRVIIADAAEPLPKPESLTDLTLSERKKFLERVTASELFVDLTL